MDTLGVGESRPIAISNSDPQVFDGGPPVDRFSMSQQEESYSLLLHPAEDRSTIYKDKKEPGFAPMQKLTGLMVRLKEGISPATQGGVTAILRYS